MQGNMLSKKLIVHQLPSSSVEHDANDIFEGLWIQREADICFVVAAFP